MKQNSAAMSKQNILGSFAVNFERRIKHYFGGDLVVVHDIDDMDVSMLPLHIVIEPVNPPMACTTFECGLPLHSSNDTVKCRDFNVDKVDLKNMKKKEIRSGYSNHVIKPYSPCGAVDIYCDMV